MTNIDSNKVPLPRIHFSQHALSQLSLILENDFTLAGKYFRLLISGKGCDGFKYSAGFTDLESNDFIVELQNPTYEVQQYFKNQSLSIIVDPFTAFYLQDCHVDYIQDFEREEEGFKIINNQQEKFRGKFWRTDKEKIPPTHQQE